MNLLNSVSRYSRLYEYSETYQVSLGETLDGEITTALDNAADVFSDGFL